MKSFFSRYIGRTTPTTQAHAHVLKFQELIVLAADLSPSMDYPFRLPEHRVTTRLGALKESAMLFITQKATASRHVQVAVVGFSQSAQLIRDWTPLSRLQEVVNAIQNLNTQASSTNIADALETALNRVAAFPTHPQTQRQPKVLLVTDGAGNVDTHKHDGLIQRARNEGVRIFTIAIANRSDSSDSYDRDLLWRMARETRGRFNTAQSLDELRRALASAC